MERMTTRRVSSTPARLRSSPRPLAMLPRRPTARASSSRSKSTPRGRRLFHRQPASWVLPACPTLPHPRSDPRIIRSTSSRRLAKFARVVRTLVSRRPAGSSAFPVSRSSADVGAPLWRKLLGFLDKRRSFVLPLRASPTMARNLSGRDGVGARR